MVSKRSWTAYPVTYRAREMRLLARWVSAGESGSVVGLLGSGRSNLLGYLCHRPEVFQAYLPAQARAVALIPVDLNNLPANDLSTIYRVMLRAFYRVREQFETTLQQNIATFYQENRAAQDPFLPQSALQELLELFRSEQMQVVLVLNRFDQFCRIATPPLVNSLRGLRDDFKDTLCYIVGMAQEVAYLPDPTILGHMYELLDNYVCWVGAMTESDARNLIARATHAASTPPTEADVRIMVALTGGFPSLLRATCYWWLMAKDRPDHAEWEAVLLAEEGIQHRLREIWLGLTQELQLVTRREVTSNGREVEDGEQRFDKNYQQFIQRNEDILSRLAMKGVCAQTETGWHLAADLMSAYVARVEGRGRGRIWLAEETGEIYQGQTPLTQLTALERAVLSFLVKNPRLRHTKTDLIINTWPDELRRQGVTDNSLYQVIFTIRQAIEPDPNRPAYLITWRGKPEGGYQFFPEGRPG